MTIEYHKTWEVMNGLEEAFNRIATVEYLVQELNDAVENDDQLLIESTAKALKEYLPVYTSSYEKASQRAWNNTVVKVAESDVPYRYDTDNLKSESIPFKYSDDDLLEAL